MPCPASRMAFANRPITGSGNNYFTCPWPLKGVLETALIALSPSIGKRRPVQTSTKELQLYTSWEPDNDKKNHLDVAHPRPFARHFSVQPNCIFEFIQRNQNINPRGLEDCRRHAVLCHHVKCRSHRRYSRGQRL